MKRSLLERLCCPACQGPLTLAVREEAPAPGPRAGADGHDAGRAGEVTSGTLRCWHGHVFPIVDGIPRLMLDAAAQFPAALDGRGGQRSAPEPVDRRSPRSFGLQWSRFRAGDRTWFKDDRMRQAELLYNLQATAQELRGLALLDAGCGNGELTRAMADYGLHVVGMDLSRSVDAARERLLAAGGAAADRVEYVQGDVLHPPFRTASFDIVHSSGVLHHTPSTEDAFRAIAPLVVPGGRLYVQLYRRREPAMHYLNVALRAVTTRLPLRLLWWMCLAGAPLHRAISDAVHRRRGELPTCPVSHRERAVQMFDNYSPRFQYRHTVPEIAGLYARCGFHHVREVTLENERLHMLALLGERPPLAATAFGEESSAQIA